MRALPNFRKPFVAAGGETMIPLLFGLCNSVIWACIFLAIAAVLAIFGVKVDLRWIAPVVVFAFGFSSLILARIRAGKIWIE
jgi:hypothetical protein